MLLKVSIDRWGHVMNRLIHWVVGLERANYVPKDLGSYRSVAVIIRAKFLARIPHFIATNIHIDFAIRFVFIELSVPGLCSHLFRSRRLSVMWRLQLMILLGSRRYHSSVGVVRRERPSVGFNLLREDILHSCEHRIFGFDIFGWNLRDILHRRHNNLGCRLNDFLLQHHWGVHWMLSESRSQFLIVLHH